MFSFLLVPLLVVAWIGIRGVLARQHLQQARSDVAQLESAMSAGQLGGLANRVSAIETEARAAHRLTSDPVWSVLGQVPWFGSSLRAADQLTSAVNELAGQALPPLANAAHALEPASLRQADGTLDLARLTAAIPDLRRSRTALTAALAPLQDFPSDGVIGPLADARHTLTRSINDLSGSLDSAYRAAQIAPGMLGESAPRRYLVIFQTPAEARGTGGLAGSFAIIRIYRGKVTTERTGSDAELQDSPTPVVDLGVDFNQRYGQIDGARGWKNANFTPHFPWAAQVWSALWERQSGQHVDGVIAVDPVALGYLLGVTGPVTLSDGETITGANAATWTMSTSYARYPTDQTLRKKLTVELSRKTLQALSAPRVDLTRLLKALGKAAGERRLLVWSARPGEEAKISGTPLAGELPDVAGPFAELVLLNGSGDKLDYYVHRELSYRVLACTATSRTVRVSFTLTNAAPATGLPAYVTVRSDHRVVPVGQDRVFADFFATRGAALKAWNLNGRPVTARASIERGHSVFEFDLELPPGQAQTVTADIREPASTARVHIITQPLANPLSLSVQNRCP